jgi:8-oxo-dGTP pyrophosphatase MutT (NUDIX family)
MKRKKDKEKDKVGLILIDKNNNLLLQLRDNTPSIRYPNCVGTFGGQIEEGETAEQAIVRELKEELEYNLQNFTFVGNFPFKEYDVFMFLKEDKSLDVKKLRIQEGQKIILINRNNPKLENYQFAFNCQKIIEHHLSST